MKYWIAMLLIAASAVSVRASGLALGAKVGTLGPGLELTGYLAEQLNVRIAGNYIKFGFDGSSEDVEYEGDVRFASVLGTFDWFPFGNNFRMSAGVALNNNEIDMEGVIDDDSTEIGDNEYTAAEIGQLSGDATFDEVVPYLGIGFGNAVKEDTTFSFSFDLGVLFQGSAELSLEADGTAANNPQFQADLAKEEADAQDDADDFKIYPVLSFGIGYYFW